MTNSSKTKKREKSIKLYIDEHHKIKSKLNIVRVDLAYKKPYSDDITLEEANEDLRHMLNNRRTNSTVFKDLVGHVCKREFTKDRGVHIHALFIYDGQKIQKDKFKGDQLGQYWEQTTKGKGSYHNCNRNEYERSGIGMIDYKDSEKRKILDEKVIPYLCKEEQEIDSKKESKHTKAFTRGTSPKSKTNMGRHRSNK